jgi:dienelactone hydrolase
MIRLHRPLAALLALTAAAPAPAAPPTLEALVGMRLIDSLTISPGGRFVGYREIIRDAAKNETRVQWYRVPVAGGAPEPLGTPHAALWLPLYAMMAPGVSAWAGEDTLYVLRQSRSEVQVHRIGPADSDTQVTSDPADVTAFALSADGRTLSYEVHATRAEIAASAAAEARTGIRFDGTVMTNGAALTDNYRIGARALTMRRAPEGATVIAHAGPARTRRLALGVPGRPPARAPGGAAVMGTATPEAASRTLRAADGSFTAALAARDAPDAVLGYTRWQVTATLADGTHRLCEASFCTGLTGELQQVALSDGTGEIIVLHERGFAGRSLIGAWNPSTGTTRVIRAATGALDGGSGYGMVAGPAVGVSPCAVLADAFICVEAAPTLPQRLVRIDFATGGTTVLSAPNAALARADFPETRFLEWAGTDGRAATGVLVLPERSGKTPPPLVITTYRCRGFLTGSISQLASEFMIAARGMAALCINFDNPNLLVKDASGRRIPAGGVKVAAASYAAIIERLAHEGVIDPARVGISGHSFGDMAVSYALAHTKLFAAAVMGTGFSFDPGTLLLSAPTADSARKGLAAAHGLPSPYDSPAFWAEISPAANAARIKAPVLMLPPETEYLYGLPLYSALQHSGGTVDMYIFPGEGHSVAREPAHQYWRNRRAIDWFAFWLQGEEHPAPETASQYDDWRALRAARGNADDRGNH